MSYVTGQVSELEDAKQYNDLLGWSYDVVEAQGGTLLTAAATVILVRIPLLRQISVTNVLAQVATVAGSTLTHSYLALFQSNGTIVGQTADQSAVWQSGGTTGMKTLALTGGPFSVAPLAANDFVWGAIYVGTAAGTLPQFQRTGNITTTSVNAGATAPRSRFGSIAQADTATLASIATGSIAAIGPTFWMGIS